MGTLMGDEQSNTEPLPQDAQEIQEQLPNAQVAEQDIQEQLPSAEVPEEVPADIQIEEERFLINEVSCIVDGPERRYYITRSELETPGFDGKIPSADEIVDKELIYQDALKHKIPITEFAQKHIQGIKRQHKLTDEVFDKICAEAGLDPQGALEEFEKMGAGNTMIEQKIMSRIYLPEHEIKEYYEAHPKIKAAKYQLQVAYIPFDTSQPLEAQKQDLEQRVKTSPESIRWGEPFWLKENDIADEKKYITQLARGECAPAQLVDGGFEVLRLVNKKEARVIPLEKRYREILHTLRMPKLQHMIDEYKKELRSFSSISAVE